MALGDVRVPRGMIFLVLCRALVSHGSRWLGPMHIQDVAYVAQGTGPDPPLPMSSCFPATFGAM